MPISLEQLHFACPVCCDSTMINIIDPGQTSSGEDQDIWPILECSRGCRFHAITIDVYSKFSKFTK